MIKKYVVVNLLWEELGISWTDVDSLSSDEVDQLLHIAGKKAEVENSERRK